MSITKTPPPIGLIPKWAQMEGRLRDIDAAVDRYLKAGMTIPDEWKAERDEIVDYLWKRKQKADALNKHVSHILYGDEKFLDMDFLKSLTAAKPNWKRWVRDKFEKYGKRIGEHEKRIKALEKLTSLVEYHNRQVDRLDSHMIEAEGRISGVEDAFNKHLQEARGSASDPLKGFPMGHAMAGVRKGWDIYIDPKASPTGIPFEVALAYLKVGREVRRAFWRPDTFRVQPRGNGGVGGMLMVLGASLVKGEFTPGLVDLLAEDWMVIPETAS